MIFRCCLLTAILLSGTALRGALEWPEEVNTAEPLARFPATLEAWRGVESPLDAEVVKVAEVDDYLNRTYQAPDGSQLGLYVGYYQRQRQGESIHSPLYCLPGAGWQPVSEIPVPLSDSKSGSRTAKQLVVQRGTDRLLVLYWYQTLQRVTASEYWRKLFLMADALTTGRTDVALVRVIAPIDFRNASSESTAVSLVRPFAERVLPEVQQRLFGK